MRSFIICLMLATSLTGCGMRYYEGCYDGDVRTGWHCPTQEMRTNQQILLDAYEAEYGEITDWAYSCFQDYVYREVATSEEVTRYAGSSTPLEGRTDWGYNQKSRIMVQFHDLNPTWTHNIQRHELLHLLMHCMGDNSNANTKHEGSEWELISQLSEKELAGDLEDYWFPDGRYPNVPVLDGSN